MFNDKMIIKQLERKTEKDEGFGHLLSCHVQLLSAISNSEQRKQRFNCFKPMGTTPIIKSLSLYGDLFCSHHIRRGLLANNWSKNMCFSSNDHRDYQIQLLFQQMSNTVYPHTIISRTSNANHN